MIRLFDYFEERSQLLINSLKQAQIPGENVLIHYEGRSYGNDFFNPFLYYLNNEQLVLGKRALFFNEVAVPSFCEIRNKTADFAEILDGETVIGKIHYFGQSFRLVRKVDWLTPEGALFQTDYYSDTGVNYAYSVYAKGKEARQFFINEKKEVLIEWDLETKAVYLRERNLTFENLTTFVCFFLTEIQGLGLISNDSRCVINSLSIPLFVSDRMNFQTQLFWQEPLTNIPGNMANQLKEKLSLRTIFFADRVQQKKVQTAFPKTHVMLEYLAPLYEFEQEHNYTDFGALIVTKSDQIHFLEQIIQDFPTLPLTIAAPTKISDKLKNLVANEPHVRLKEVINEQVAQELIRTHSIYLNLNEGREAFAIRKKAFLHQLIVLSLDRLQKGIYYNGLIIGNEYQELHDWLVKLRLNRWFEQQVLTASQTVNGELSSIQDYQKLMNAFD